MNGSRAQYRPGGAIWTAPMGRVSIWKQWLGVAVGAVLYPVFVLLTACLIGWLLLYRLWPRSKGGARVGTSSGSAGWGSAAGEEEPEPAISKAEPGSIPVNRL